REKVKGFIIPTKSKALLFSLCYMTFLTVVVLFTKGGMMNSFNRYLFATPFFIVAMHGLFNKQWPVDIGPLTLKTTVLVFLFSTLFWMLFASYVHIRAFL